MATSISSSRWQQAQEFEVAEWRQSPEVTTDEWQELVSKYSKLFPQIARQIKLKSADLVLDIGCATTVPSRLLDTGRITGIEPLADALGISGKDKIAKGVTIVNGKAEHLPFPNKQFKLAVCRNVIDHTQTPHQIIDETYRVLQNRGYLLLFCYTYAPFITWIKNTSERLGILRNVGHPFTFTPGMLDQLVDSKFTIVKRYTIHTGQNSTDYGKVGRVLEDHSLIHKLIIWLNRHIFRNTWFLKEYGYLAKKND